MNNDIATISKRETPLSGLSEAMQKKIMAYSERISASSSISIPKIRNDAKSFIMPDGTETESFVGVIVGIKHANIHYSGDYEEGKSNPPDCVAVIEDGDAKCNDLSPHPKVISKYSTVCATCKKFEWGSDKGGRGRGKECAEYTLLALHVPSLGDRLHLLECKKSNSKDIDNYIRGITDRYGHPIAVTTKFTMGEGGKWQQNYSEQALVAEELITNLVERMEEANEMLVERVLGSYSAGQLEEKEAENESPVPQRSAAGRKK